MELHELGLSVRAFNAVCRAEIKSVPELYNMYQCDSEKLRLLVGNKHFTEIGDALAKHREAVWEDVRVSEETEESAAPEAAVNVPETLVQHDFLSLESDCFIELRQEFDAMLQKTLASMIRRDSDDATLTLKLHLRLDHTSDSLQRAVIRPDISHKITSAIMVKDDLNGRVNGDYELLYDAAAERYLLRELPPEEGQMSLL
jgi:rhodanese-related sulfurtransferase